MKKILLFISILCGLYSLAFAQHVQFSQFYNDDLELNPALTGLVPVTWQPVERLNGGAESDQVKASGLPPPPGYSWIDAIPPKWRIRENAQYRQFTDNQLFYNSFSCEYKINFLKSSSNYGLTNQETSKNMIGLGIIDNRGYYRNSINSFSRDFLSLALHKNLFSDVDLSLGIQPGVVIGSKQFEFNVNAGILLGINFEDCWHEDQFFKTQIGVSAINILQNNKSIDTMQIGRRMINAHVSTLVSISSFLGIIPRIYGRYDSIISYNAGLTFIYRDHGVFVDRERVGVHYSSNQFIVISGGFRIYGEKKQTWSVDFNLSYDFQIRKDAKAYEQYKRGLELAIVVVPTMKCWSLLRCNGGQRNTKFGQ